MGFDLTYLQDVPLLMRRDEQGPLIPVALLPLDDVAAQVVARGLDVFQQPIVMLAVLLERGVQVAQLAGRPLSRYRDVRARAVDPIPEHVRIAHRAAAARRPRQGRLQIFPVDRRHDNEMLEHLGDRPPVRPRLKGELLGTQAGDLVGQPCRGHLQVRDKVLTFEVGHRRRRRSAVCEGREERRR